MHKRAAKGQASKARAAGAFAAPSALAFGTSTSQLSYVAEPPNLSSISDPNAVVYFRNLSKKDNTTKAKALEDLHAHVAALTTPVEDGFLEAWVAVYPRTSIANAKAVRQLAHSLHGHIAVSAGKRIARHMPQTVAAWLCGLYDSDRAVVEATQNSLRLVFSSPDKIQNIRKAYQRPILEYCRDAIDKESPTTLSDERIVSPDDAAAKYSRVISACISLLGSLLANLQPEELAKFQGDYEQLLGDKKLWGFAPHPDTSIRRSLHRFLKTCLAKETDAVETNLETISKAYLAEALNSDQSGSIVDYVDALTQLTTSYPSAWTTHYKSKTPVDRRLRQFLKKGSQFGPRDFWSHLAHLIKAIPRDILPYSAPAAVDLLDAMQCGISSKNEARHTHGVAYESYLDVVVLVNERLPTEEKSEFLGKMVVPIIAQYLQPAAETSQWSIPSNATNLLPRAMAIDGMTGLIGERWPQFAQQLIDRIKTSAPEQSKDYEQSQTAVSQHATRYASLQEQAAKAQSLSSLLGVFSQACSSVVAAALDVVRNRNGKPYGAAAAIAVLLHQNQSLLSDSEKGELEQFVQKDLPAIVLSPSATQLVDIMYSMAESAGFTNAWGDVLKAILKEEDSPVKTKALEALLTSSKIPASFDLAMSDLELQKYVRSTVHEAVKGSQEWDTFNRILQSQAKILTPETTDEILAHMTQSLSITELAPYSLQGLRQIVKSNPSMLREFSATSQGSQLLQGLLRASESPDDEVAQGAAAVSASIQTILASGSDTKESVYDLIRIGLQEATQASVSVETLVGLAKQSVQAGGTWEELSKVFPGEEVWQSALNPFLETSPKTALGITNPLGSSMYLIEPKQLPADILKMSRDIDGYSSAYRIAQYITRLVKDPDVFPIDAIPADIRKVYVHNTALTAQLAGDNLGLAGANGLWVDYNPDVEAEAMAFISDAQTFITEEMKRVVAEWSSGNGSVLDWAMELFSKLGSDTSPQTHYTTRVYSVLVMEAIEMSGWKSSQNARLQDTLKALRKSKGTFALSGFLHCFREPLAASKSCERMCNELVADLTGLDIQQKPGEGLAQLILLNAVLGQEGVAETVAKQRLIFFVKHIVPWLNEGDVAFSTKAEVCRALKELLPFMSDIYGEHWGDILNSLAGIWSRTTQLGEGTAGASPIPFVHASLKLYGQLSELNNVEDPNDDFLEVWKETEQPIANGLINLLKHSQHFPDEFHQPLKMVNVILARQIAHVPLEHLESTEELYPLLYVESQPVQQTAFNILHKQIPVAQEQISIDAALSKSAPRLPEELLSLIIEAPTVAALAEVNLDQTTPLALRGYLYSWLLVFDHLEHASFKVKNDYVENIKEGDYIPGLLDFTFEFLGHSHNKPVDVSKFEVTTYQPDIELPKQDIQWLLTHVYFLCLRHVPSLTKSWFISCKSRAIVVTLESWTEKHISPPVIAAALQAVTTWSEEQDTAEPDSPFSVKVAPRAREITGSYLVDEQTMSMRIALPAAFPLANAHIEGLNRVAVNDVKWQSWLRTSLGAINIFNGSLIDALTTFKRNVDGALKGQTECSICYSIVGGDRKLPDKRCQTCRNLFHGSCLFKWFKTSGSSSCPLCRNPFNYA